MEIKECLKSISSSAGIENANSPIGDIENLNAPESQQIMEILEQFLMKQPVRETADTKQLLDRYVTNYPYLELYRGAVLQGIIIIDYALSVPNVDICLNIINMLLPLWDKDEPIESWQNQIGYYSFIRQIMATLSIYNVSHSRSAGIQELLSTQLYTFGGSNLAHKLKQEDTFQQLKQIRLDVLAERSSLLEHVTNFDVFCKKNENLLQNVFGYSMNMNRLIHFKKPLDTDVNGACLQQVLEIDLFSLIGDIMFDENANVTLNEIEAIVCNLNTNLIHVITKNTCPAISICDKFNSSPNDELNAIHRMLIKQEEKEDEKYQIKSDASRKPFKIKRHDIFDYVRQHNELIAYILGKIHGFEASESNETRKLELNCSLFDNIIQMEEVTIRSVSSDPCDQMLAALRFDSLDLSLTRELIQQKKYR